jgi:hypothetical protein
MRERYVKNVKDGRAYVFLDEVQATVTGDEASNLLAVLDELHTDALTDGRVRLLSLNAELLKHDALGVGRASEGVSLQLGAQVSLVVLLVGPPLDPAVVLELARSADTPRLAGRRTRGVRQGRSRINLPLIVNKCKGARTQNPLCGTDGEGREREKGRDQLLRPFCRTFKKFSHILYFKFLKTSCERFAHKTKNVGWAGYARALPVRLRPNVCCRSLLNHSERNPDRRVSPIVG